MFVCCFLNTEKYEEKRHINPTTHTILTLVNLLLHNRLPNLAALNSKLRVSILCAVELGVSNLGSLEVAARLLSGYTVLSSHDWGLRNHFQIYVVCKSSEATWAISSW